MKLPILIKWRKKRAEYLRIIFSFLTVMLAFAPYVSAQYYEVVETLFAGIDTQDVDVNPNTNIIYVAALGNNALYVIDGETNTVITTIPVGIWPRGVVVDIDTNRIYVGNSQSASVSVINGTTNSVVNTIAVGNGATEGMKLNPINSSIYVTNWYDNTVSVIDITTDTVVGTIPVGSHPAGVAINSNANIIYVSNRFEDTVSVIDGTTNTVTDTLSVGFYPGIPDFNPVTNRLYLPIFFDGVWILDGNTNEVISKVPVGGAVNVTVDTTKNLIYAINSEDTTVSIIDGASNNVIDSVPVGPEPFDTAVNPITNRIYATHMGDDTLSVIAPLIQTVDIDVKPGSYPNSINLKSRGKVPVAILTTDNFDANDVDPVTCEFAGACTLHWNLCDLGKDGDDDMILHFKTQELNLDQESTEASLVCKTYGGTQIIGTDSVNIVPKGKGHFKRGKKYAKKVKKVKMKHKIGK